MSFHGSMISELSQQPQTNGYETMRKINITGMFALTSLVTVGCAAPASDTTDEARAGIEATNAQFMAAVGHGDAAGVAACYTEDAQLMPPNGQLVSGRAAIQETMQGFIDSGVGGLLLESIEVQGHGDMAHELGRATLTDADGQVLDESKYIVIWKKVGDEWKLHRDIFNSDLPLPTPEEHGDETGT